MSDKDAGTDSKSDLPAGFPSNPAEYVPDLWEPGQKLIRKMTGTVVILIKMYGQWAWVLFGDGSPPITLSVEGLTPIPDQPLLRVRRFHGHCGYCDWVASFTTHEEQKTATLAHSARCVNHPRYIAERRAETAEAKVKELEREVSRLAARLDDYRIQRMRDSGEL